MRTRIYDVMTNAEVTDYLMRRDVIFIPVGTAEMHGSMPLACEHILPLAVATRMADLADGLVLPGLVYFYPGASAVARGTVQVSPSVGAAYLKAVCQSLLRQGFRRQILISFHGPASVTIMPVVREFFDETKCPIVYVDLEHHAGNLPWEEFNKMVWGAYGILGRLEEIPSELGPAERTNPPDMLRSGLEYGYYYIQDTDHGWWPQKHLSPAERKARADEGVRMIDAVVQKLDPAAMVEKLRKMDDFFQHQVIPRHGPRLPS